MLGASRRSLSAVARFRGAAGCRALSPSVSSPDSTNKVLGSEHGAPQLQKRLFTLLSAPNTLGFNKFSRSIPRESITINRRYESNAAAVDSSDSACEKFEYQAEVNRLMDLIVHSLYSNKEVFLRESVKAYDDASVPSEEAQNEGECNSSDVNAELVLNSP